MPRRFFFKKHTTGQPNRGTTKNGIESKEYKKCAMRFAARMGDRVRPKIDAPANRIAVHVFRLFFFVIATLLK
jgi:hypothetical protein